MRIDKVKYYEIIKIPNSEYIKGSGLEAHLKNTGRKEEFIMGIWIKDLFGKFHHKLIHEPEINKWIDKKYIFEIKYPKKFHIDLDGPDNYDSYETIN